jgi:hypothetical protein
MKVICIEDRNRPNEIPTSKWVKKGNEYTIIDLIKCNVQGGLICAVLEEIDMTGCEPYEGFNIERFASITPDKVKEEIEELELV